jgi:arylsulfatase A-like enzyme
MGRPGGGGHGDDVPALLHGVGVGGQHAVCVGQQVASHLGGTRNPLVVRCPQRITDRGGLRSQFTHVTDIGPTILDMVGIPQPAQVDGVEQQAMTGVTFAASLSDAGASEHHTQHPRGRAERRSGRGPAGL